MTARCAYCETQFDDAAAVYDGYKFCTTACAKKYMKLKDGGEIEDDN